VTLFEYLAVAFSIVLSLAAVRLLGGLSVSFAVERRYWPHALWVGIILVQAAMVWWNYWSFRDLEWNFFLFLFTLFIPGSIYLQAAALVPENPGSVQSWMEHFYASRRRFFFALGAFFPLVAVGSWLLSGFSLLHPARVFQVVGFALAVSGAVSAKKRWHELLPLLFGVLLVLSIGMFFFRPGALQPEP
jgi:hypothetical protein